ncbi:VMAP-C domain-containing protein [Planktothrix serta]|nr:hypothetical protein [Planktothrix serta]
MAPATTPPLFVEFSKMLGSIFGGNTANTLDLFIPERDSDVSLQNQHLTKAVGKAMAAVITLAGKKYSNQKKISKNLKKIAIKTRDNWHEIPKKIIPEQLKEDALHKVFITQEKDVKEKDIALEFEEWGEIFQKLKQISLTPEPVHDCYTLEGYSVFLGALAGKRDTNCQLSPEVDEYVINLLVTHFPIALRETLKEDFAKEGKAFAALTLKLLAGTKEKLDRLEATQTDHFKSVFQRFQKIEDKLNDSEEKQNKFFQEISQEITSGFAEVCNKLGVMETTITGLLKSLEESIFETASNVKKIILMLEKLPSEIKAVIEESFQKYLPPDRWLYQNSNDIERRLTKLEQDGKLHEFGNDLIQNQVLPEDISDELSDLLEIENKPIEKINKLLESYLIVTVEYGKSPEFFSLNAWLVIDDSVPRKDKPKFIPLIDIDKNKNLWGVVCQSKEIPKQLDNFIKKAVNDEHLLFRKKYQLTIEIFLPSDLMYMNINSWEIDHPNQLVQKIPLGAKYSMRLRLLERIQPKYQSERSDWLQNWDKVRNCLDKTPTPELFEHLQDTENLTPQQLEIKLQEKIGLKVTCCLNKQKVHRLFLCILFTKTPIVVWTRCEIDTHQVDEIDKILMSKPLKNLCKSVQQTRKEANAEKNEKHLGCHLSLLWDNPYRIPPDVMLDLRSPGQ